MAKIIHRLIVSWMYSEYININKLKITIRVRKCALEGTYEQRAREVKSDRTHPSAGRLRPCLVWPPVRMPSNLAASARLDPQEKSQGSLSSVV